MTTTTHTTGRAGTGDPLEQDAAVEFLAALSPAGPAARQQALGALLRAVNHTCAATTTTR